MSVLLSSDNKTRMGLCIAVNKVSPSPEERSLPRIKTLKYMERAPSEFHITFIVSLLLDIRSIMKSLFEDIYEETSNIIWGRIGPVQLTIHSDPFQLVKGKPLITLDYQSSNDTIILVLHPYPMTIWNRTLAHFNHTYQVEYRYVTSQSYNHLHIITGNLDTTVSYLKSLLNNYLI